MFLSADPFKGISKAMVAFDKEKYIQIMKAKGISEALTTLHRDVDKWEVEAFEGETGYQPEMWKQIEKIRDFSRELWDLSLQC